MPDTKVAGFASQYPRDDEHPSWILFPRDVEFRKSYFPAEAITHPAKMQCFIVTSAAEYYGTPGCMVLDPFAGTGTTALAALGTDYTVHLIELEDVFTEMLVTMKQDWVARGLIQPNQIVRYKGDCRAVLAALPESFVDLIITSPPYSVNAQVGKEGTKFTGILAERKAQMRQYGSGNSDALNIGRLNPFQFTQMMKRVYERCLRVTKPGGLYISVTKDHMAENVRQRLSVDIIKGMTEVGWEYTGDWFKWKAPGGMLANVMRSKGSEVVDDEDIIVFRRPA